MFWPDDGELAFQEWWAVAAWPGGPTYGTLVRTVRPALRAALLLGHRVLSVNVGFGRGVAAGGAWQSINGVTLVRAPGVDESIDKQAGGPTVWLDTIPIYDRLLDYGGPYGREFTFGQFGSDETTTGGTVPAELANAVDSLVARAVEDLATVIPTRDAWQTAVAAGGGLPRHAGSGLLWLFDPVHLEDLGAAAADLPAVVEQLIADREAFLLGQIYAERAEHDGGDESGPANLRFLLARQVNTPDRTHDRIWTGLLDRLQARGQAHRIWERGRRIYRGRGAPTWLDVLTDLVRRGVVTVPGLHQPAPPPYPLAAEAPDGDPDRKITLTVWGGSTITLTRQTVFADGRNDGLTGSVAWDYAPGTAQVKPTVIVVAGRGVAVDHRIDDPDGRPWRLEIFRVQDDRLVPRLGSRIDPTALLATAEVGLQADECVFDPADAVPASPEFAPQILVKPQPHGIRLVYPVSYGTIPVEHFGGLSGSVTPCVIEVSVDPKSGTAAYAIDAHYHTDDYINLPANVSFKGGVQVSVWTTGKVTITASNSGNITAPAAGDPSVVYGWTHAHQFIAELWTVEAPAIQNSAAGGSNPPPHPLPRPWSVELPVTGWSDMFPPSLWDLVRQEMWDGLVPGPIQDFLSPDRDDPLPGLAPHVAYDRAARRGRWHDPVSGADYVLRPAPHQHAAFGETENLFYDLFDAALGFVPFIGDAADVAELVYAWQTGRDRWGRRVSEYQLAQMMVFAAVPFVSSSFLDAAALAISGLPELAVETLYARLFAPAPAAGDFPVTEAQAALAQPSVLRPAPGAAGSPGRERASEALLDELAEDAATGPDAAAARLATRLVGGTTDGWLDLDDLLSDDRTGFRAGSLHLPYLRFLRDNPGIDPVSWIEAARGQ